MLYIFYFADLQQIFKTDKIRYNAHSDNILEFFGWIMVAGMALVGHKKADTQAGIGFLFVSSIESVL